MAKTRTKPGTFVKQTGKTHNAEVEMLQGKGDNKKALSKMLEFVNTKGGVEAIENE